MRAPRFLSRDPSGALGARLLLLVAAAVAATLVAGCRDDADSPTAPLEPGAPSPAINAAAGALPFRQVSGGGWYHTCGVTADDRAYCWGYNFHGLLGLGTSLAPDYCFDFNDCSSRPIAVAGGLRFRSISAGGEHTCGVTNADRADCWGDNYRGQLGVGVGLPSCDEYGGGYGCSDRPLAVRGGLLFRNISAGAFHTCGVTTDGLAYCWGGNFDGELGDGTTTDRPRPVAVAGGRHFREVSTGDYHTCGVTTDDRAYCWGANGFGELGDSTTEYRVRPGGSSGRADRQIAAGAFHTCAVTTD